MILLSAIFGLSAFARIADPSSAFAVEIPGIIDAATQSVDSQRRDATAATPDPGELAKFLRFLREREMQLDERARKLDDKASVIAAGEARLREQIARLEAAESKLAELVEVADGAADKDVAKLVGTFEAMDEKRAGPIFENMDVDFAAGLLGRMEGTAAADILGVLSPEKAYAITVKIAGRNARAPVD